MSLRLYTQYPSVVEALPYVDEVRPLSTASRAALRRNYWFLLSYPLHVFRIFGRGRALRLPVPTPKAHLTKLTGNLLGLEINDVRPDCVIRPCLVTRWRHQWCSLPRPHILISRRCAGWWPNKDWPDRNWVELIGRLEQVAAVIETGTYHPTENEMHGPNYVDLRGQTTVDEFVAAIAAADLHIGPISGPVHVAAAAGTPSVVIYGGTELPANTSYPGNVGLYTALRCSPCWLSAPCPYGTRCLSAITPKTVEEAVWRLWTARQTLAEENARQQQAIGA